MKDRFRQIIENAELPFKEPHTKEILLDELEVVSASEKCEALAVEMMEKFDKWKLKNKWNLHSLEENKYVKMTIENEREKWHFLTTRELIAKFLSDYTHNSNTQKR